MMSVGRSGDAKSFRWGVLFGFVMVLAVLAATEGVAQWFGSVVTWAFCIVGYLLDRKVFG